MLYPHRQDVVSYGAAIFACAQRGFWRRACFLLQALENLKSTEE